MKPLALISVSDKRGLEPFASGLIAAGFELLSTGGTAAFLRGAGLPVVDVSTFTGSPEVLAGRVKTLHPRVFAAILADLDEKAHRDVLTVWKLAPIAIVAVNLYPFAATAARADATVAELIENLDIGGPSLVRAAAKNHRHVAVIVDPEDYSRVLAEVAAGGTDPMTRRELAVKAFRHTAAYDATVASVLPHRLGVAPSLTFDALAPALGAAEIPLRYGENPHQQAVFAATRPPAGFAAFTQLQGKELSHNNLMDADGAWRLVHDLPGFAVAIIKHGGPCGVALGTSAADVYAHALACDPVSAFGGVIASTLAIDAEAAARMTELFAEVVIAAAIDDDARAAFAAKKNLRVLLAPAPAAAVPRVRVIDGGMLIQTADEGWDEQWHVVTARVPEPAEQTALTIAWRTAKYVASNAIVIANETATVGIGGGQPSRVESARIATAKAAAAGLDLAGTAAGSDGFFPFPDGVEQLAAVGVTAIVQPGGSLRDADVIAAANRLGIAMVFTGRRHFRH